MKKVKKMADELKEDAGDCFSLVALSSSVTSDDLINCFNLEKFSTTLAHLQDCFGLRNTEEIQVSKALYIKDRLNLSDDSYTQLQKLIGLELYLPSINTGTIEDNVMS